MGEFYAIYLSDLTRPEDVRVDRRVNRAAAEKIVRELNQQAVAKWGPTGPLYYVERVDKVQGRLT
jgi:hypothetical protein